MDSRHALSRKKKTRDFEIRAKSERVPGYASFSRAAFIRSFADHPVQGFLDLGVLREERLGFPERGTGFLPEFQDRVQLGQEEELGGVLRWQDLRFEGIPEIGLVLGKGDKLRVRDLRKLDFIQRANRPVVAGSRLEDAGGDEDAR
jgi:hypothetical protein